MNFFKSKPAITTIALFPAILLFCLFSCTKEADSAPEFIFKPAPRTGLVANFEGEDISEEQITKGVKNDIYELEKRLYELKYNNLKALLIKKMVAKHPKAKGRSSDAFMEQEVLAKVAPTQKQIEDFIKERSIPKERLNDQIRERIKTYLTRQLKEEAADKWLAKQSKKHKIEVYLKRPERPFYEISVGAAPVTGGGARAKVTLIEFSDFECQFCRKGAEVVAKVKKEFGNKVRVAFKHFPLHFHKKAKVAAHAAMCAHEQNKKSFWTFHDLIFADQKSIDEKGLEAKATKAKLDMAKFKECMKSNRHMAHIDKDIAEGKEVDVQSTPTFFINGRAIRGAKEADIFEEIRRHL